MDHRKQLVIGNGVLGRSVATALCAAGLRPTVLSRQGGGAPGWDAQVCDVRDGRGLAAHLTGPTTLYVCAAPPYWRWPQEFPLLAEGIAKACAGRDVDIVYADNLYAYGDSATPFTEGQAYKPCSRKGEIRQQVVCRLMALNGQGGVRSTVVRGADFFGPNVLQSSLGKAVVDGALAGKPIYLVGNPDVAHAVTYVPDFAAALVQLGAAERAFGRCWHVPSHNLSSTRSFVEAVARRGGHVARVKTVGPLMIKALGLFNPAMRELREMLYLFDKPWSLASDLTAQTFGLSATALDEAIDATVAASVMT
jgi:nucleoside-diphosphate-sugar epimerase